jgi:acetylornithine/succinyldiaminopimelate/putrescine aminotransferase
MFNRSIMSLSVRQLFLQHVAQTSPAPIGLEIVKAEGVYMWDKNGKKYLDLISGFSVMNLGHGQPAIIEAIKKQVDDYMHLMVYGEIIEAPQVLYAKRITEFLPESLDCVYFTNSGSEATEGAMKLAKRVTGRSKMVAFKNAYHGSTQGALSIMGGEYWRNAYRPLLPDVWHADFNTDCAIEFIDEQTACVVMELVQAEAGVLAANANWIKAVRKKCTETGAMLIFDEIQTGFGRTGTLWAFEQYEVVPDILLLGKALGGGLPLGAFISSHKNMQAFTNNPVLGHISTFAGHPVCCAAGLAGFELLLEMTDDRMETTDDRKEITDDRAKFLSASICHLSSIPAKEQLFRTLLTHPAIKEIRSVGFLIAVQLENADICVKVCHECVQAGIVTDWFLFAPDCLRIAPPLIITNEEITMACQIILQSMEKVLKDN